MKLSLLGHCLIGATCAAGRVLRRDSVTAVVNFSNNTGPLSIWRQESCMECLIRQINFRNVKATFYTNIGYNYERAGGAQVPAPGRGWIWGLTEYNNRFASVLSNYKTAREHGANFIFLIHDLWGADGTQNSSAPYPGDNGNWADWDDYLSHVFSDMQTNGMTDGMIIDIWNEPDGSYFWNRDQTQYLEMWGRTYYKFRNEFGTEVLLSGPASAGEPVSSNSWWQNWASYVAQNKSVPDQYAWHMESGSGDMLSAYAGLQHWLSTYNLPQKTVNINEYAVHSEQVPAGSAWWISQLERVNAHGLRGNWLGGWQLHDYLASLLSKPDATTNYSPTAGGYFPNGDYQVYRYYNQNMTGYRVGTLPSGDLKLDAYATVGNDKVARVLVGVRLEQGTWELQLNDLSALGLPTSGTLNVHTWGFHINGSNEYFGEIDGPTDLGWNGHTYSGDTVTFPIYQTDTTTAYAFEFVT